jgi:hypothetical protein
MATKATFRIVRLILLMIQVRMRWRIIRPLLDQGHDVRQPGLGQDDARGPFGDQLQGQVIDTTSIILYLLDLNI